MSRRFKISKKGWIAFLLTATFLVWRLLGQIDWRFATTEERWSAVIVALIVLLSSAAAGYDSTRVHLRRYDSGISYGPVGLFVVCALFWPIGVLWYLVVRIRIKLGKMPLKSLPPPEAAVSPSGLVQPWRNLRA